MSGSGAGRTLDVAFLAGSSCVWALVATILCWRLPASAALSYLGRHLTLDVYRLPQVRAPGSLATTDVLVIAGAMAFMPLQSLDAEFRFSNYGPGVLMVIPPLAWVAAALVQNWIDRL